MCPTIIQQQTRLLKISWILLLASGIGILGFGIIVTAYPQIGGHTVEGLLRAIGVATTGMGIFGIMITLEDYPIFWTIHWWGNCHQGMIIFIRLSSLLFRYWVCYFLSGSCFQEIWLSLDAGAHLI